MTEPTDNDSRPITLKKVADVARAFGVCDRTVLRMVQRGHLKPVPVPGTRALRFDPGDLPKRRPAADPAA